MRSALEELRVPSGFSSISEVQNLLSRLSKELLGEADPGVVFSPSGKTGEHAPYSKLKDGKLRARCALWASEGGCSVSDLSKEKKRANKPVCSFLSLLVGS